MARIGSSLVLTAAILGAAVPSQVDGSTADHSSYEVLRQEFESGPEVTRACLTCHVEASRQVMSTIHWTWVCPKSLEKGPKVGKAHVVNNFCMGLVSNEPRCTSCHAGYGWKDSTFDFSDESKVDCLVCHDGTGTYKKFPTDAGHPAYEPKSFGGKTWEPPDLTRVAQSVGRPKRNNCGACHFYGGGGEGVKHADLDASLYHPTRDLDVHMAKGGANFVCQDCHTTREHAVSGRCYGVPATEDRTFSFPREKDDTHIYCESCHGNAPHDYAKLNDHVDRVSCQACHIPFAARGKATKYWWDWSKAGQMGKDGKPQVVKDDEGNIIYHTKKGEFRWDRNTVPEYVWFSGAATNTLLADRIDDSRTVPINHLQGSAEDPEARIWPVKVHRGKQPYDPVLQTLVVPKLFGPKGSGAYWAEYDWTASVEQGMLAAGMPFSGEVGFVETEMYWPITHMVAPKEQALQCSACHASEGRLAGLGGFYMPRRDRFRWLDGLGWVALALVVVVIVMPGMMIVTHASTRGFDETVSTLENAIVDNGWATPGTMDLKAAMAKKGVNFGPRVKVIKLCNAGYAKRVLEDARHVSSLMPCSISVWEDDDGKVFVSKMNTGLMGKMFGGTVAEVMGGFVAEDEAAILSSVIDH